MEHYERRLPHWNLIGNPLFVTFRLHGSLPMSRTFPPNRISNAGRAFVVMDRILDQAAFGPRFLERPEIADLLVGALVHGVNVTRRYELHAFAVMPNHVHLLLTPNVASPEWLGPLKGFTAHRANQILERHGQHFWQDESYDHLVRSWDTFERIKRYIEANPVKAGLAKTKEAYRWSSGYSVMAA
jgi:REP element-mobilizing transposase RayT